jgi:hypothetical protein
VQPCGCCVSVWPKHHLTRRSKAMARSKTPRITKPKTEKKVLQMPETGGNGNVTYTPADLEAEIRLRAYELYQQRGYLDGQQDQDWLAAEREVLARHSNHKTA